MKKFFDIHASVFNRWVLGSPLDPQGCEVDPRLFIAGKRVAELPLLTIPVAQVGEVVDFNLAAFDMPVTPRKFNEALERLVGDAIQRIPVTIQGYSDRFEILNLCETVDCLDEIKTKHVMKWNNIDGRLDKIGEYRMIVGLQVDPSRIGRHHIFRLGGWEISPICSEDIKNFMESFELTGVHFEAVC